MRYRVSSFLLALSLLVPTVQAGQVVLFSDGRSLEVQNIEFRGEVAVLLLEGGSRISTPALRVARVQEVDSPTEASLGVVQDAGG